MARCFVVLQAMLMALCSVGFTSHLLAQNDVFDVIMICPAIIEEEMKSHAFPFTVYATESLPHTFADLHMHEVYI